jgi:hypothetical protein
MIRFLTTSIWYSCILLGVYIGSAFFYTETVSAQQTVAPLAVNWLSDFALPLLNGNEADDEKPFDLGIKDDLPLLENLKKFFYPSADAANGSLWRVIRTIAVAIFLALLIRAGARFLLYSDSDDEIKKSKLNLLYILYGAALFFLAFWLLSSALDFGSVEGVTGDNGVLKRVENNVVLFVMAFLKAAAFFVAIIFMGRYGYKMLSAPDQESKLKEAKTGILNVVLALVFIKIIDFVYFIANQQDFKSQSIKFVAQASKFLGYLLGILLVLSIIYAGYLYVTSAGNKDNITKAQTLLKSVFIAVLLVLLFLLIVYQVFSDVLA